MLLNKIDQLEEGRLTELTDIMRSLNPLAQARLSTALHSVDSCASQVCISHGIGVTRQSTDGRAD